ncbi:MAG: hypothetical protein PHU06_06720 [Gallionella sp.]|nr:hypothetical protein [Gallionella sp.]MDD4958047.1 hypothetical protein [Gallionella sp.]
MNDEIMHEVHAIKDGLAKKYGNDLKALLASLTANEAKLATAGFEIIAAPAMGAFLASSTLQRTRFIHR